MGEINLSERHGRLFFALLLAAHRLRKVADRKVTMATDLTATQAAVLYIIASREAVLQKEIASLLGQNESAVAAMVVRLIKLGFLDRRRRDEDGRASLLSLTQTGRRELEATKAPFEELDRMLDGALAPDELDALTALLTRVATAFASEPE